MRLSVDCSTTEKKEKRVGTVTSNIAQDAGKLQTVGRQVHTSWLLRHCPSETQIRLFNDEVNKISATTRLSGRVQLGTKCATHNPLLCNASTGPNIGTVAPHGCLPQLAQLRPAASPVLLGVAAPHGPATRLPVPVSSRGTKGIEAKVAQTECAGAHAWMHNFKSTHADA
eukprot:1154077-Pelagomonas_calceolata.AAC.1